MTDIVERLRAKRMHVPDGIAELAGEMAAFAAIIEEAADEIERLRAEIRELRGQRDRIANRHLDLMRGTK